MMLPKGAFKGLARVLAPLWLWMAAGWFAYPSMILKIAGDMGVTMDSAELHLFSRIMVTACIVAGVALAVHGFTGKEPADAEIKALAAKPQLCPYCGAALPSDREKCPGCHRNIPGRKEMGRPPEAGMPPTSHSP